MAIEESVFPEPWSLAIFTSELALREGRAYRIAREGRTVVGYYGLMFAVDEAHVTTVAVDPGHQGKGVGTAIMAHAMALARDAGMRHVSLEVAAGNERAQRLYRRFGFLPVGVRKGYYAKTGEDAFVMWARDIGSPAYAERLAGVSARLRSNG
jgi:ribosomal-protein-alanine N-acetyltransferase